MPEGIFIHSFDITDRKRSEEELRTSQARLASIVSSAMDGIITTDSEHRIVVFNAAAETMFGYSAGQVMGQSLDRLMPERFRSAHTGHLRTFGDSGAASRMMGAQGTILGRRADGTEFPIETSVSRIEAGGQTLFTVILRDITERQRTEMAQRNLARRLAEVQEQERVKFSRELHDQTGQEITALLLYLESLMNDPKLAAPVRKRLAKLASRTQKLARSVHQIAWELRPAVLDDLGLAKALRRHSSNWSERSGVPVDYHCSGLTRTKRADPLMEITLYRIAQEALHNVWKHAGAKRVSVLLQRRMEDMRLIVEDDGKGFEVEKTNTSPGRRLGLTGMRERAALVGGALNIESTPGKGTSVFASIPMSEKP